MIYLEWVKEPVKLDIQKCIEEINAGNTEDAISSLDKLRSVFKAISEPSLVEFIVEIKKTLSFLINRKSNKLSIVQNALDNLSNTMEFLIHHPDIKSSFYALDCQELRHTRGSHKTKVGYFRLSASQLKIVSELNNDIEFNVEQKNTKEILIYAYKTLTDSYEVLSKGDNRAALENVFKIIVGIKKIAVTPIELTYYQLLTTILRTIDSSGLQNKTFAGLISRLANIIIAKKDNSEPIGTSDINHALSIALFYPKMHPSLEKFLKRVSALEDFLESQKVALAGSMLFHTQRGVLIDQIEAELKLISITCKNSESEIIKSKLERIVSVLSAGGYEDESAKIASAIRNSDKEDYIDTILKIVNSFNVNTKSYIAGGIISDKDTLESVDSEITKEFGKILTRLKLGKPSFENIHKHAYKIMMTFKFLKMDVLTDLGVILLDCLTKCNFDDEEHLASLIKCVISFEQISLFTIKGCGPSANFINGLNAAEDFYYDKPIINKVMGDQVDSDIEDELKVNINGSMTDLQILIHSISLCDVILGRTNKPNNTVANIKKELSDCDLSDPGSFVLNETQMDLINQLQVLSSSVEDEHCSNVITDGNSKLQAIDTNSFEVGGIVPPVENQKLLEIALKESKDRLSILYTESSNLNFSSDSHRAIHSLRGILRNIGYSKSANCSVLAELEDALCDPATINNNPETNFDEISNKTRLIQDLMFLQIDEETFLKSINLEVQRTVPPSLESLANTEKAPVELSDSKSNATPDHKQGDALSYLEESAPVIQRLSKIDKAIREGSIQEDLLNEICRHVHTLKGAANMLGFKQLGESLHCIEDFMELVKHNLITIDQSSISSIKSGLEFIFGSNTAIKNELEVNIENSQLLSIQESITNTCSDINFNNLLVGIQSSTDINTADHDLTELSSSEILKSLERSRNKKTISKMEGDDEAIQVSVQDVRRLLSLSGSNKSSKITQISNQSKSHSEKIKTGINTINSHLEELKSIIRTTMIDNGTGYTQEDLAKYSGIEDLISRIENTSANISVYSDNALDLSESLLESSAIIQDKFDSTRKVIFEASQVRFDTIKEKLINLGKESSIKVDKLINLNILGNDELIEKSLLIEILPVLQHMIRNSVDHGIELPSSRKDSGKEATGEITISVKNLDGVLEITFEDDGQGIDPEYIYAKAIEKGLDVPNNLTSKEKTNLIFMPGFSTTSNVSEISGRGVGMDVVHDFIEDKGGNIDINSKVGASTKFIITLPLVAQSSSVFICGTGNNTAGIPRSMLAGHAIVEKGDLIVELNGMRVPIIPLSQLLGFEEPSNSVMPDHHLKALVVKSEDTVFAISFSKSFGLNDVYIKPLPGRVEGVVGVTDFSDGSVISIIDPIALFRKHISHNGISYSLLPKFQKQIISTSSSTALVIDDSPLMRNEISKMLNAEDYEAICATDGADAMGLLDSLTYDFKVITLDIEMPNIDGLTLLKRIKTNPRTSNIPVIMVSSRAATKYQEKAFKYGADEFIVKPVSNEIFNNSLKSLELKNGH